MSGGGARGFAHLGVIKLLEELGIRPHAIAGASMGAVAGALYAAGKKPEEIMELLNKNKYLGWSTISWQKAGFFSMDVLRKILTDALPENNFDALPVKLFVSATDIIKGETVMFSSGNLIEALIASSSIPVIFEPLKFAGKVLVDGGVLNNFPLEPLTNICDVVIGSHVNKIEKGINRHSLFKTFDVMDRCFHLAVAQSVYTKVNNCDVFIEPALEKYGMNDVKKADEIFKAGYTAALDHKIKLMEFAAQQ